MPSGSEEERRLAEMLASRADHHSVTAERLDGSADAVADLESPVVADLVDGEEPKFCFDSHDDGVGLGDPDATVDPERGGVFLFTDLRVYLRLGLADGDKVLSLPYEAVATADHRYEMGRHRVRLDAEGSSYHLWIPATFEREDVARAVEYATYRRKQATPDRGRGGAASDEPQTVRDRLERLGDAKSRGLIDEEEFQRRKEELLDE